MEGKAGAGGYQAAYDDVFLEAAQTVAFAGDGGFGKYARGLLERGRGNKRFRGQRCLGDTQQYTFVTGGTLALALTVATAF